MHYYQHDIGSFAIETKYMTFEQKGIYVDLVDYYLATGKPLASDWLANIKRVASEEAVNAVLSMCFVRDGNVYRSEKLDRMIAEYEERAEKNRANARKPRKKAEKSTDDSELAASGEQVASESLAINNYELEINNQEVVKEKVEKEKPKRDPLVAFPESLPAEWSQSASEVRADVSASDVFCKLHARYVGTAQKKAMKTWRKEFLGWVAREYARPQQAQPVRKFTEEYYRNSLNPDGTVDWGI